MGKSGQHWSFAPGTVPSLDDVCAEFSRRTGLVPEVEGDRVRLAEAKIGFVCSIEDNIADVWSGVPYHPYLWRQLSLTMETLGGQLVWPDMQENIWPRPGPEPACLSRPWSELTPFQQRVLRRGTVLMSRPFDRWL